MPKVLEGLPQMILWLNQRVSEFTNAVLKLKLENISYFYITVKVKVLQSLLPALLNSLNCIHIKIIDFSFIVLSLLSSRVFDGILTFHSRCSIKTL